MFFFGERPKGGELPEDNSSSAGASASSGIMGFFPLLRGLDAKLDCYLAHLFHQDRVWDNGLHQDRSQATCVQHNLATPSSTLHVPYVSSLCPGANRGIDLLAIGSSGCLTSQLPWTNQTWEVELTELPMTEGC